MVESKETVGKTIPVSKILRPESRHQYEALIRWSKFYPNHVSGYACHLGEVTSILWVPATSIQHMRSVSLNEVGRLGVRAIDLSKQRVDWPYLILGRDYGGSKS